MVFGVVQNIHHKKHSLLKIGGFTVVAAILIAAVIFGIQKLLPSAAKYTQTDNNGSFTVDFTDSAGISDKSNNIVVQDGALVITDNQPGYFITSEVHPASSGGWIGATVNGVWSAQADVKAAFLDCTTGLPVPGVPNNTNPPSIQVSKSGGFNLRSIPDAVSCIKIMFSLQDSTASGLTPSISKIGVNWTPQTVYGLRLAGTPTTTAGNNLIFNVDYSFSYADSESVVIYMSMPQPVNGSYTPAYNQDLSLTFGNATGGGQYTANGITVGDVIVPANSVYWNLGAVQAGDAGSVSAQFRTRNGLENGVQYNTVATVGSKPDDLKTSNTATSTITSAPRGHISKSSSNTVYVSSESTYYVYDARPEVRFNINTWNYDYPASTIGYEALFNPVVVDDLTNIKNALATCGVAAANLGNYIKNISDGGVLNAANGTITWGPMAHVAPSSSKGLNFTVDFSPCIGNSTVFDTNITNIARITTDNQAEVATSHSVNLFGLEATKGAFAKGEQGSINVGINDPTYTNLLIPYGGTTTYNLHTANEGLNRLDDIVIRDKIPAGMEFVSATLPASASGTIYYYANTDHTDPRTPPTFDYTSPTASGWTTSLPTNPADVQWVAFYVPCLASGLVPAAGSCQGKPQDVTGNITVRARNDAYNQNTDPAKQNVCSATDLENWGDFAIYSSSTDPAQQGDSDVQHNTTPIATLQDREPTTAYTERASLSNSSLSGPQTIGAGEQAVYQITVANGSNVDSSDATEIRIPLPTAAYGNETRTLDFISFSGTSSWERQGDEIVVHPGVIPRKTSRAYTITLLAPRGVLSGTQYTVNATMTAGDMNNCGNSTVSRSATTTITGQSQLTSYKTVDQNLIGNFATPGNDAISYHINLRSPIGNNTTPLATKNTYVIDQVPARTTFSAAYTTAPSAASPNQTHNCSSCRVYFASRNNTNLPGTILTGDVIAPADIKSQFVLGTETSPGVWRPNGMAASDVLYVAYLVDDPMLGMFPISSNVWVGMDVTAEPALSTGSIITNAPVTISDQTLSVIANTVRTIVLNDPGLGIEKTASSENVLPDAEFDWYVDYINDSSADDTMVSVTDTLPPGVELLGIYNSYNPAAIAAGKPSAEQEWTSNIEVVSNSDGSQNVIIHIADINSVGSIPLDILAPQQGGRLRLHVRSANTLTTGDLLLNQATGCYQNETVGPYCIQDDSTVEVQAPDLDLQKSVSDPNPRLGDEDSYSLILRNIGAVVADGVTITDTLPVGLCYIANSTNVTPNEYAHGEPSVSVAGLGGDCAHNPTTLVWDFDSVPTGNTDIILYYRVSVNNSVGQGNTVSNSATAATTTFEPNINNNTASASLTTPIPDAYVTKRASSNVIQPGETFNYFVGYGNNANERATGIYIVDELPDINGDGLTDITIESIIPASNETAYYYDANVSGPLGNKNISASYNFAADADFYTAITDFDPTAAANPSYPTHIVIVNTGGILGGGVLDYYENAGEVIISARAVDPYTGHLADINTEYLNAVHVGQTSLDTNNTNNQSSVIVTTPAADLAITKTGSSEGAYPGIAAGDAITYDVAFANNSGVPICGVYIVDTMPAGIQSFTHNFNTLSLTNRSSGQPMAPQTPAGVAINSQVTITYDTTTPGQPKWYLGSNNPAATDYYMNVCLPGNSSGNYEIHAITDDTALDQTEISNTIHINQDTDPAAEKYLVNNDAVSTTYLYRSNLRLVKTATTSGADQIIGTSDDSTTTVNPGETIRYRLEYSNNGHYTAADSFIADAIPAGTCYMPNSIDNLPISATVRYSSDDGSTWDYTPTGTGADCSVTNIMIDLGDMMAPANTISGMAGFRAELGDIGYKEELVRTDLLAGLNVKQISAGFDHTCAIASDGQTDQAYCWGSNNTGQLGNGSTNNSSVPVAVNTSGVLAGKTIKQISAGRSHTCAIASDGQTDQAYCWGANYYGQLGDNSTTDSSVPVIVDTSSIPPNTTFKQISVGYFYTCAIASNDRAYCWGLNSSGQLGDNSTTDSSVPVIVDTSSIPPNTTFKQISTSNLYTCAIASDGQTDQAYCWGDGYYGQLGAGSTTFSPVPVAVDTSGELAGKTIKQISAYEFHTCAIASDGQTDQAYCWGSNNTGQLGNGLSGAANRSFVPVAVNTSGVLSGKTIKQISAGFDHTCAIASDGQTDQAYCWGSNFSGELGNGLSGFANHSSVPVTVDTSGELAGKTIKQISAGGSTCAIASDGQTDQAYCWGRGAEGQLGNGSGDDSSIPVAVGTTEVRVVVDPSTATQFRAETISTGGYHTCAIASDDQAYCWGRNNSGQLGDGTTTDSSVPVAVDTSGVLAGKTIKQISAGYFHTCAIASDDKAYCWGSNVYYGQLGNNSTNSSSVPVAVDTSGVLAGKTIKQISAGATVYGFHTCAIASDDKAYCWGHNGSGQLGNNSTNSSSVPVAVDTSSMPADFTFKQISVDYDHTCAIASDDKAYCWGGNGFGQLGNGTTTDSRVPVAVNTSSFPPNTTFKQISAGGSYTCAIASDDQAYCWGSNVYYGQLGNNSTNSSSVPVAVDTSGVLAGKTIKQISAGYFHTCAIASDDKAYCWGHNGSGQLGNNSTNSSSVPVAVDTSGVLAGKTIKQISAGQNHTCAIASDNQAYCWGSNVYGQLGNDTGANHAAPVGVYASNAPSGLTIKQISAGGSHTCAIASDDQAYCWGNNTYGQLGNNSTNSSSVPVAVDTSSMPADFTFKQISVGHDYTCAIASDDQAYCWGNGSNGKLGNNFSASSRVPVAVDTSGELAGKTIKQISANENHTCAIASDDRAYCWGQGYYGQLGAGSISHSSVPVAVDISGLPPNLTFKQITSQAFYGNGHTCAIASDNQAYCWGINNNSQLGDGSTTDSSVPVAVNTSGVLAGKTIKQISAGQNHTCAIASDDKAYCWGGFDSTPVAVNTSSLPPNTTFKQISAGDSYTCAIASDNQAYCWGSNTYGQLGNNSTNSISIPVAVNTSSLPPNTTFKQISAGYHHTCAIASDNQAYCWGSNSSGQLGILTIYMSQSTTPSGVWIGNPIPTDGARATKLSAEPVADIAAYDGLYIDQRIGDAAFGGTVNYFLKQTVGGVCAATNPDVAGIANPVWSTATNWNNSKLVDISMLDPAVRDWCIVSDYAGSGDLVTTYRMSYDSHTDPFVTFDARVVNPTMNTITNTASINTPTPEITKMDNTSSATLNLLTADLSVDKTVDQTYLNPTDTALGNVNLTYDIIITNNGNNPAINVMITDTLPTNYVDFVSAAQTASSDGQGGAGSANFACTHAAGIVTCTTPSQLAVGHSATITIVATVKNTVVSGNRINNLVEVTSSTLDLYPDNNLDSADSMVAHIPNIYAHKTASRANVNVDRQFSYLITVGNDGTADAPGWQMVDELDPNLVFMNVGITAQQGISDLDCHYDASVTSVICDTASGNLPVGASATIEVFAKTVQNYTLADNRTEIENEACTTTTTTQNISDDCSTTTVTVIPGDGSTISGRVFVDYDRTVIFNSAEDYGITGVDVTLYRMNGGGTYEEAATVTTNANGEYDFYNLRPGTYELHRSNMPTSTATGSRGGYLAVDNNNQPLVSPRDGCGSIQGTCSNGNLPGVDVVTKIELLEGESSRDNNFGVIYSSIGNFVWRDLNTNGIADAGEPGISGVELKLYADTNVNGTYDDGVDTWIATTNTNSIGYYVFDSIVNVGAVQAYSGTNVIVVVTDSAGKLTNMVNTPTPAGHATDDNYSKNGAGYTFLFVDGDSNMTADFGYASIDPIIQVAKTDNNTNVEIGDSLTYGITVTNAANGSPAVDDVVVVDTLPATLDYVGSNPAGVWNPANRTITWTISSLAYGTPANYEVFATVNSTASTVTPNNTITNPAHVTHAACDNDGSQCSVEDVDNVVPHDPTITITKDDSRTEIEAGQQTTYTITVANTREGSNPATNVVVTDTLPSGLNFNSTTEPNDVPAGLYSGAGHDVAWTIPSVAHGSPVVLTVTATVGSSVLSGTTLHNYVSSDHAACAATGASCMDDDDNTVIQHQPSVSITKTDNETTAEAGDTLTYTVTVANTRADSSAAADVVVTDTLPHNARFVSATGSPTSQPAVGASGGTIAWTIPNLSYGANVAFSVVVTVDSATVTPAIVTNAVALTHTACLDVSSVCSAVDEDMLVPHDPTLVVSKTDYRSVVEESDEVTYTITATNIRAGSSPAANVVMTDTLPANTTFISATGSPTTAPTVGQTGNVVWTIPNVTYGTPVTMTVTVRVNGNVNVNDEVVNNVVLSHTIGCASVNSNCTASDTDTVVLHDPSLVIGKDDGVTTIEAGTETTYNIVVTNPVAGSSVVTGATVTDTLPANTTFISATGSPTTAPTVGQTGNVVWTIPNVTYGTPVTMTVTVRVNDNVPSGSTIINQATIDHAVCTGDADADCEGTDTNTVIKHDPELAISKTNNQTGVLVGETLTYQVTVANTRADSSSADDATVVDILPGELTFISASAGGTFDPISGEITWTGLDVAYGSPIMLTVVASVRNDVAIGALIENVAYVEHDICQSGQGTLPACTDNDEDEVLPRDAQLVITKDDKLDEVERGQEVTYGISITNTALGSSASIDASVTDTLPAGLEFVSASDDGVYDPDTHSINWIIPSVDYGVTMELNVVARVADTAPGDEDIINTVQIDHDNCDIVGAVCSASDSDELLIPDLPGVPDTGSMLITRAMPIAVPILAALGIFAVVLIIRHRRV